MKHLLRILIIFSLVLTHGLDAQGEKEYGFLNIIYAIPDGAPCEISIDGAKINEEGFKAGEFTGGLILEVGQRSIEIVREGEETTRGKVTIEQGITSSYAIFNQIDVDKKTDKPVNRVRIIQMKVTDHEGYHLQAVSLCEEIKRIQISSSFVELNFLKPTEIPGWNGGGFSVSTNAKQLGSLAVEESGTYVILVGRNEIGKDGAFFFRHIDFELPAWFQKPKP